MKANELRIGNWVKPTDKFLDCKPLQIDRFSWDDLFGQLACRAEYCIEDEIEPIPLTEEWLIRFGAIRNEVGNHGDEGHVIYYELEKLTVCDWGNELIMSNAFAHGIRVPLRFVHQLQNLYFALTGEELIVRVD